MPQVLACTHERAYKLQTIDVITWIGRALNLLARSSTVATRANHGGNGRQLFTLKVIP